MLPLPNPAEGFKIVSARIVDWIDSLKGWPKEVMEILLPTSLLRAAAGKEIDPSGVAIDVIGIVPAGKIAKVAKGPSPCPA